MVAAKRSLPAGNHLGVPRELPSGYQRTVPYSKFQENFLDRASSVSPRAVGHTLLPQLGSYPWYPRHETALPSLVEFVARRAGHSLA
jgi:hypothetical protein